MTEELQRRQEIIGVFERITKIVWQRLSPTFGIRTVNAIARNVIARQSSTYPRLAALQVGEDGLVWGSLEARLPDIPVEELRQMLESFTDAFFDALANLIGRLITGKLFKEAEEAARQGSEAS